VSVAVAVSREYVEVWRTDDCAAFESVYVDENGVTCSELVIWDRDGSRYRELICGADLTTIRRDWEAASPFDKVQVPDDAGRKVWTHLVEDEPPAAVLEPEPARVSRVGSRWETRASSGEAERATTGMVAHSCRSARVEFTRARCGAGDHGGFRCLRHRTGAQQWAHPAIAAARARLQLSVPADPPGRNSNALPGGEDLGRHEPGHPRG
jgi:hypothetical protein